jgi:hypothetical protein
MELYEALEVIAGRELDFINDVRITGDVLIDGEIPDPDDMVIIWMIPDVEEPTHQEIEDMMELDPFLRIKYDSNGFIWKITKGVVSMPEELGKTITTFNHPKIAEPHVDEVNMLPLYKYVNGDIFPVADPYEYSVDQCLWGKYTAKYQQEISDLLRLKTNAEMKDIFDNAPAYKQEMIFTAIQYFWTDMIPQWNINLSVEIMGRLMMEKLYIETIENRQMTADELSTFNAMLSQIHASNIVLKNAPTEEGSNLDPSHWYNYFLTTMNQQSMVLRQLAFNQRVAICGR